MKRLYLSAALAAMLPGAAMAEVDKIKEVVVETDVSAIANERAVEYWSTLSEDLQAAITTRIVDA
jgi:hypothetical protein